MKPTSFAVKTALLATLILTGKTFAQSLPDEINHPQYLKVYQNLEQVLATKTAEYQKLSAKKSEIEKLISEMVRDQSELPARNSELQRHIVSKKAELTQIASEMGALETLMGQVVEDLRRIDAVVAQLQKDIAGESSRAQQIQARRSQVAQDVAQITARLQQEQREEQQSFNVLNNLTRGMNNDIQKKNEDLQERANLIRQVESYKRELPQAKNKLAQANQAVGVKQAHLTDAQGKLPAVKASLSSEQSALTAADAELNPKKAKIAELKAELSRLMPEVSRLQKENTDLAAKIQANKVKISGAGIDALKTRRDTLESELSGVNAQIKTLSDQIVNAKEALKPELEAQQEVRKQVSLLQRSGSNPSELNRLKAELDASEKRLAPKRLEIARLEKQHENVVLSVAPKNQELTTVKENISRAENSVVTLTAENEAAEAKIAANNSVIEQGSTANAGLVKSIADLEASITSLATNRERLARSVTQLKAQETQIATQIAQLSQEVKVIEAERSQLTTSIAFMEKANADYPLDLRRIENRMQKYDEQIQTARLQISREEKLLARIQESRVNVERNQQAAQSELDRVSADLASAGQLLSNLQTKLQQENQSRESLTRYNQDSIRKYDGLKSQKQSAEDSIVQANQEIGINNQDISTISQELPKLRSQLMTASAQVSQAENVMNDAQKKSEVASGQFQERLSLFQRYLSESESLGAERALIGTTDGVKAGSLEAKNKASKLAAENAASEAKWVAMRRGYIHGEISGFDSGYDQGLASSSDSSQGETSGRTAGIKRAVEHANLVLKPEFYLEELNRRLVEDSVSLKNKMLVSQMKIDEVSVKAASAKKVAASNVPELTQAEISASNNILSSLDSLIQQALSESSQVISLRSRLADPRGVYTTPGPGLNANMANCAGVYKNVKEFVDACKSSYGARYQSLFVAAHQNTFTQEYGKVFSDQVIATFEAELNRLYPVYLKEAQAVGQSVGLAAGKKEIYRQSFERAEANAYATTIPQEESRAESEAVALVEKLLTENAALTLQGNARLESTATYGIAPGSEAELKMIIKNIGSKASLGNSLVRIKEVSSSLSLVRETAIASLLPKSSTALSVMKVQVSDSAVPGTRVVIAGEIVHPGDHYRAARTENFRLESVIAVNPSVETGVVHDITPNVATLGITKKHDLQVELRPKYEGVDQGYEVSIEEVGSVYVRFTKSTAAVTERLARGVTKKINFEYKLEKASKGKIVNLKITIKNGGAVVKTIETQLKPK